MHLQITMPHPFEQNDVVWCHSATSSNIWPAKICVDPTLGEWTRDEKVFLLFFGQVRCQTGKWINATNVVGFETFSNSPEFNNSALSQAFYLAKEEFLKNGSKKHLTVQVTHCKPTKQIKDSGNSSDNVENDEEYQNDEFLDGSKKQVKRYRPTDEEDHDDEVDNDADDDNEVAEEVDAKVERDVEETEFIKSGPKKLVEPFKTTKENKNVKKNNIHPKPKQRVVVHIKVDTGYEPILDLERLTSDLIQNDSNVKESKNCQKNVKERKEEKKKKSVNNETPKKNTANKDVFITKKKYNFIDGDSNAKYLNTCEEDKENTHPSSRRNKDLLNREEKSDYEMGKEPKEKQRENNNPKYGLNKDHKQKVNFLEENEEKSDYEMIQEKRKAEQKELLEEMKQASAALSKTPKRVRPSKVLSSRQCDLLPLRSSARKEQQRPSDVKPRTTNEETSTRLTSLELNVSENLEDLRVGGSTNPNDNSGSKTRCHHCRKKSTETKTVCGSGKCQGHFCAGCLKDHYGEDFGDALKDRKWKCPPCRGACKCSECRDRVGTGPEPDRQGKRGSAILTELAVGRGYKSVRDYLESLIQKLE
jgi:hypothetical protein